jgi:hypothetical protein
VKTLLYPILRHRPGIVGNITLRELISEHVSNSADKKKIAEQNRSVAAVTAIVLR